MKPISEVEIVNILEAFDYDKANDILRGYFAMPENIHAFAWFCFGDKHLTLPSPPFHREMLEIAELPGFKGIAAPRGFAKSTNISLNYAAWVIANCREHFIILISDTYTQAVEQIETLSDALVNSDNFKRLYGNIQTERWARGDFETSTGIRVLARGKGQKIRGLKYNQHRPGLILVDDLENDEAVQNPDQRKKDKRWFLNSVIPALRPGGSMVYIGTILHFDSLLNNIIQKKQEFSGWTTKLYKAINVDEKGEEQSLWPELWSVEKLKQMAHDPSFERYIGSLVFAQEYQNEPFSEEDAIIKPSWIHFTKHLPELTRTIIIVDPAISKGEKADFTAKVAMSLGVDGNVYISRIGNDRMSFTENIDDIKAWNKSIQPSAIAIEAIAFQQAFGQVLLGLPVIEVTPDKDKVRRTIAVSRFFEAGKVFIQEGIRHSQTLLSQLIEFPSAAHDDLVDAVVYGLDLLLVNPIGSYGSLVDEEPPEEDDDWESPTAGIAEQTF